MARLEQSADASNRGGGFEVTDESIGIIDEYLILVSEHLPDSISEEVISELRSYMMEMARDLGDGDITIQSAKKAVAKFGAPSEVALEYKYSMMPETVPSENDIEATKEQAAESSDKTVVKEKRDADTREVQTSSFVLTVFQGALIAVVWSLLVTLSSTLLGPLWLTPNSSIILLLQIALVVCMLVAIVLYQTSHKKLLWKKVYPEWPVLQKFLTLPENAFLESTDLFLILDIVGSGIGIVVFFISTLSAPSPYYFLLIVVPISITFLAKSIYSGLRMGSQDPIRHIRAEILYTFAALVLIDSSQIWQTGYFMNSTEIVVEILKVYSIIWGSVLFLQLVARSGDLWWSTDESKTTYEIGEKLTLLHQTNRIAAFTILKLVGWVTLFSLIPTYCLLISHGVGTPWFGPLWIAMFFGPIFFTPIIVYFLYRRWSIKQEKSNWVIGERSRVEACGDLLISSFVLFGIVSRIQILGDPNYLEEQLHYALLDFGSAGELYYLIGYISSILLLLIGLVTRIIGNGTEFRVNRRLASMIMTTSGMTLIVSLSIRIGIDIVSHSYLLFPIWYYPAILFLVIVISFQVETSKLKLGGQYAIPQRDSSSLQQNRDSRVKSLQLDKNSEEKMKYQGNQ